ncbi:MAG: Hpt domain-containing protein [Opitutales bacterium]|nr:Hpt domain-containing protein [Opitutales bacterium]
MSENSFSKLPVLDDAQINMLKETAPDDAAELFTELKDLFEEESEPLLAKLEQSIRERDCTGVARSAHALAGSSSNIGYLRLSKMVRALENSDLNRSTEALQQDLSDIQQTYAETRQAMADLIDSL